MPDPDDLGTHDGYTIDVGPVSCPACKRPYVSAPTLTEEERRLRDRLHQRTEYGYEEGYAEVYVVTDDLHDALAIIDRLSGSTSTGGPTEQHDENCPAVCPWVGGDCYAPEHDDHACSCPASAGGPSDG